MSVLFPSFRGPWYAVFDLHEVIFDTIIQSKMGIARVLTTVKSRNGYTSDLALHPG